MKLIENEQRIQTICLIILTTVAGGFGLYWLRPVLVPFVLAVFIAIGLSPVVDIQVRRLRFPRWLAVTSTLIVSALVLVVLGLVIAQSAGTLAANADDYKLQMEELVVRVKEALSLDDVEAADASVTSAPAGEQTAAPSSIAPAKLVGQMLLALSKAVMQILSNGALIAIFLCFLLSGKAVAAQKRRSVEGKARDQIQRYIVTKVLLSLATGVLVGLALWIIGVELAMVFGLLAFLLNFIPSIGSIIATLLPLPVVIASPDASTTMIVLAVAVPFAIQVTLGSVLEPRILGKSLDLHPVVIIMALIFWGMLWGVVGMLLAAPITAVAKGLLERTERGAPLAALFAGRMPNDENGSA